MTSRKAGVSSKVGAKIRGILDDGLKEDLIVTPVYEEWLGQNPEGTVEPETAAEIARFMSTPDRVRSGSFSASSAGLCMRRQELAFLGTPVPGVVTPRLTRIFNNGKWVHLRWQAQLLSAGIIDKAEATIKKPSLTARCSLDGMGVAQTGRYEGYDFALEIKGRNDYDYNNQLKNDPDEKTRRQVDMQFLLHGFEVMSIINENKNNQEYHEWVFYRDEERVNDALMELRDLNRAIDRQILHSMLHECKRQTGEFNRCPFGGIGGPCVMAGKWPAWA